MTGTPTIRDALEAYCREHPQVEYSARELINGVTERLDVARDSVMPYDYCVNHENKGSSSHKIFERVGRGRYRFLGAEAPSSVSRQTVPAGSVEAQRLLDALEALEVDIAVGEHLGPEFFYGSLPLALADAIFSLALRYDAQCAPVVQAFARWLDVPLARGGKSVGCAQALEQLEQLTGDNVTQAFGGKRYRTSTRSGILKAEAVRLALRVLVAHGINDFADLRSDKVRLRAVEREFERIPGQSRLTAWKYFVMLAGDEYGVKPDRHLLGFTAAALGRATVSDGECESLVTEAAHLLSVEYPWMTPRRLDYVIWSFERQ